MAYPTYKYIHTNFKNSCTQLVGEELGIHIARFYRLCLDFGGYRKVKGKTLSLKERRLKHIKEVVCLYDKKIIIEAITIVSDNIKKGKVDYISVKPAYFETVLYNLVGKKKNKKKSHVDPHEPRFGIPVPKTKLGNEQDNPMFNWIFVCPDCGEIVQHLEDFCSVCYIVLKWDKVNV